MTLCTFVAARVCHENPQRSAQFTTHDVTSPQSFWTPPAARGLGIGSAEPRLGGLRPSQPAVSAPDSHPKPHGDSKRRQRSAERLWRTRHGPRVISWGVGGTNPTGWHAPACTHSAILLCLSFCLCCSFTCSRSTFMKRRLNLRYSFRRCGKGEAPLRRTSGIGIERRQRSARFLAG